MVSRDRGIGEAEWAALERSGCLLQRFVPESQSRGEISLVFLSGRFSHAVLKRPRAGDFRVQMDFGGSLATATPEFSRLASQGARRCWSSNIRARSSRA